MLYFKLLLLLVVPVWFQTRQPGNRVKKTSPAVRGMTDDLIIITLKY
jgi:hypothetical protein